MKKIICFTESLAGGGAEHQITILADLLNKKDYNVILATFADLPDHYKIPDGVSRIRIAQGKNKLEKLLAIFLLVIRTDADCIISYRMMSNFRILIPRFFRRKPIKIICGERNLSIGEPDFVRIVLSKLLYRKADYIVPNSLSQTKYMEHENPKTSNKLRTIYNYTDIQHYRPGTQPENTVPMRFAIFARYSRQKNPIRFAEAMSILKQRTEFKFVVDWYGSQVGNNQELNDEFLNVRNHVEQLGISDVLQLKPAVKDPSFLMSDYHAICLPSLYEGFSNSIAEAICCGKPMLVSDVSDNHIMVHDGENGFLFNPKDLDSIVDAFTKFMVLPKAVIVGMGKESRRIAETLFDEEKFIHQYIDLIES